MDLIQGMRAFTKVAELGGFAAAARDLGVSRSMLNKQVNKLENELGAQLLTRSTRRVAPTETGNAFYARCMQILADVDDAFGAVQESHDRPSGKLRINAPMTLGTTHLAPIVAEYMTTYPDVRVDLVLNDRYVDPLEEGFDITVRVGAADYPTSLVTQEILAAPRVLCCAPDYLKRHGTPAAPDDLKHHRILHYGYQESGLVWRLSRNGHTTSVPVQCAMWSNNGQVLSAVAQAGNGIAMLPTFIVSNALSNGSLVPVLEGYPPAASSIFVLYPRHRHLSTRVRLFVQLLTEVLTRDAS